MLRREKSTKSLSPLESARKGFEILVKIDRADSGKLNIPSPHGSFQRTQSFIKQMLSMKADLNQLFPTEEKEKAGYSSPTNLPDKCSSSRSYGKYKKTNRNVKLAPLTPEYNNSTASSTDVTPASSIRISIDCEKVHDSPPGHVDLWGNHTQSQISDSTQFPSLSRRTRRLQFAENEEIVDVHNKNGASKKNSAILDIFDHPLIRKSLAPLQVSLPHTLHSASTETAVGVYVVPQFLSPTDQHVSSYNNNNNHITPHSFSHSTDIYDDSDRYESAAYNIRTKSFNGAGLLSEDCDSSPCEEEDADDDIVDLDRDTTTQDTAIESEVELFLESYCSGKEKQAASAKEAFVLSSTCNAVATIPLSEKNSVKQRKGTGISNSKKLLSLTSIDSDDEEEDEVEAEEEGGDLSYRGNAAGGYATEHHDEEEYDDGYYQEDCLVVDH